MRERDADVGLAQERVNSGLGEIRADRQKRAAGLEDRHGRDNLLDALLHDDRDQHVARLEQRLQLVREGEGAGGERGKGRSPRCR